MRDGLTFFAMARDWFDNFDSTLPFAEAQDDVGMQLSGDRYLEGNVVLHSRSKTTVVFHKPSKSFMPVFLQILFANPGNAISLSD